MSTGETGNVGVDGISDDGAALEGAALDGTELGGPLGGADGIGVE